MAQSMHAYGLDVGVTSFKLKFKVYPNLQICDYLNTSIFPHDGGCNVGYTTPISSAAPIKRNWDYTLTIALNLPLCL